MTAVYQLGQSFIPHAFTAVLRKTALVSWLEREQAREIIRHMAETFVALLASCGAISKPYLHLVHVVEFLIQVNEN